MPNAPCANPFELDPAFQSRPIRAAFAAARPFFSAVLGLRTLQDLYARRGVQSFESRALEVLGIGFHVDGTIPSTGATIVAANHPTGVRDGLVLLEAVRATRPDVRILANRLLERIPELADSCFFVDPFGGPAAAARSRAGLRAAHHWLRAGGALIIFPSGEVASRAGDATWHPTTGRLALATDAHVVPAFLDGSNSPLFYAAGRIHPRLRTLLLGRELLRQRGTKAGVRIGATIDPRTFTGATPAAATAAIRRAVDNLRTAPSGAAEIVAGVDPTLLAEDVSRLPARAMILTSGPNDVICAGADELPNVLREIGRLRELTFRAVGEGTGRAIDLDRFDGHYRHLFVWNRVRREVIGAYRLGATDAIVAAQGVSGLYTRSLFRYDERLLSRLGPALELGRSFVRAECQRTSNALLLLWQGIGRLVAASPRYRVLFGPVSISSRYQNGSRHLLRAFLSAQYGDPGLASLVDAISPPPPMTRPARPLVADVEDLETRIRALEVNQGIPVLLRQYLRLNATVLGFNVDPAFGDALDALMMVSLDRLPARMRRRYLGVPSLRAAA